MKNNLKNKLQKKGSVLAYALVIMFITMIILVSMLGYIVSQLKFSSNRIEREKSFQVAEAGIYWYRWYLAHKTSGKPAQEIKEFWQTGNPYGVDIPGNPNYPYEADYKDPEGKVVGRYRIEVEPPDPNSTIVTATATGWTYAMPDVKRTVQVRFRRSSWSEFVVLANSFMRFGEGTNVFGKIHSNMNIRFDGIAHNIVTSKENNYDDPDHSGGVEFGVHTHKRVPPLTGISSTALSSEMPPTYPVPIRNDVFMAGRQMGVPEVSFTGVSSDLSFMKAEAKKPNGTTNNNCTSTGCYFDSNGYGRHIVFNGTTMSVRIVTDYYRDTYDSFGRVLYQGSGSIRSQSSATTYTIPNGGVIFVEDNVWLEGTINGKKITVVAANLITGPTASTGNIFLGANNLLYTNFDGRDIIGLLAQNNVEIMQASQNVLTIDGALLAKDGRVGRKYYTCGTWQYSDPNHTPSNINDDVRSCRIDNPEDHRSTITMNGSMATNLRYGFAYTDGTGYTNRNLNFDNNLLYYPPPYFPTGTEYLIDLWEEI